MTARSGAAVLTALSALDVAAGMTIVLETSEVGNQPNVEVAATAMMRFCWHLLFRVSWAEVYKILGEVWNVCRLQDL